MLNEWEVIVFSLLKERIDKLKQKYSSEVKVKQVLKDKVHLQYLKDFQDRYVLASADKAGTLCFIYTFNGVLTPMNAKLPLGCYLTSLHV